MFQHSNLRGALMVTQALSHVDALQRHRTSSDPATRLLAERTLAEFAKLMVAKSPSHLRLLTERVVKEYLPLKMALFQDTLEEISSGLQTPATVVKTTNEAILEHLSSTGATFSKSDTEILIGVLREQARMAQHAGELPIENRPYYVLAVTDSFWALQKLDVSIQAALFLGSGDLKSAGPRLPHWLCLAARGYLSEWQSALFANDPVLRRRLSEPTEFLTTEELE